VQVFDHGVLDDGTPYIAMELLTGENLEQRIVRGGPMRLVEVVDVLAQCCKALTRAHAAGIIHRDIKPANILVAEGTNIKLADFGAVRKICDDLIMRGRETLEEERVSEDAISFQRFLDMRYSRQEFSIPVPIDARVIEKGDAIAIREAFDQLHEHRYGYHTPGEPVEIVNVRVSAFGRRTPFKFPELALAASGNPSGGKRLVYFKDAKSAEECPVFRRQKLPAGYRIEGPAVIQEYASTTVLFPGDSCFVAPTGEIVITVREGE